MSERPNVILTGGRGRVGSAILAACRSVWNLRSFSRIAGDGHRGLEELLCGKEPLRARALIHCAWSTVPATAEGDPGSSERIDLPLLREIIARVRKESEPPLLVFMSTGSVYGPAPGRPSKEGDVPGPIGSYARGKLAAEELLLASGLPTCVLRVGNVYGLPSARQNAQGVIAKLVRAALTGETVPRWGADSVKDYIHSSDFTTVLQHIVARPIEGVWNVGTGAGTSLSTLIALVEQAAGCSLKITLLPAPKWDVADNRIDVTRLKHILAWQAAISIEEGIHAEFAKGSNYFRD